jgi:uncharacterized protein (TIGR02231 family)
MGNAMTTTTSASRSKSASRSMRASAFLGVVGGLMTVAAATASASPSSAIESVVVFPDRARVTRVQTARCERGTADATFDRLPAALDVRTLRGEVREAADVIGVGTAQVNSQEAGNQRARELIAQQEKIDADVRANEARKSALAVQLQDLGAFGDIVVATLTEEMRNPRPDTPGWARTIDALRARRAALEEDRRRLDVALRGLRLDADRVARQLMKVGGGAGGGGGGGAAALAYRTATVTVGCRHLAEVTASISYVVPGATWQPEYDVDFTPRGSAKAGPGGVRLTVGAQVRQATGEDWGNVRLALSTARPKLGAEAPQPVPLIVDGYEQRREKVLVDAHERREQLGAGGPAGAGAARGAAVDDKGNAFVLTLPHRVTIAADGRPVWAPVDVIETQGAAKLTATPKLDEHVYQVVTLKNPAPYALLDGRVRSYRGGSYVGESRLRYRGVGEPFEVSLGLDEELKVSRKTVDQKNNDAGFLSGTKHMVRVYRVELTNRAATAEAVELRENIPVSKIADVTVGILDQQTTPGFDLDRARGIMTWSVSLKSGEKRNVDLGYAIHLPDSWTVR